MILESIYEGNFSRHSHGFRPNHSCHTALMEVKHKFIGTKWFIEGDIKGCFDNVDHAVLINLLRRRIKDEYFISLIWKFLKAGYMEDWVYYNTYSGTPQGSIISPILANIYLHELDCYMEQLSENFHCGKVRRRTSEYQKQVSRMQYLHDRKYGKDATLIKIRFYFLNRHKCPPTPAARAAYYFQAGRSACQYLLATPDKSGRCCPPKRIAQSSLSARSP